MADDIPIGDKVAFLADPANWPGAPRVTVRETHMSWVFLAGDRVLKLKKPVRHPRLDFSTLAQRARCCRAEVALNRRLSDGVYRGVVPLTRTGRGRLALGGDGEPVEWLVDMTRLPAERMLDAAIETGAVTDAAIRAVGGRLVAFYRAAERVRFPPGRYVDRLAAETATASAVLLGHGFDLDVARTEAVLGGLADRLRVLAAPLEARADGGFVVEGHGDLRPEHVCLTDPPVIIDCLEFDRDLRLLDPYDELSFLGLECRRLGAPWIGAALIDQCDAALGGRPAADALAAYAALRAVVRARLAVAHLLDPQPRTPAKWEPLARVYVELAEDALSGP